MAQHAVDVFLYDLPQDALAREIAATHRLVSDDLVAAASEWLTKPRLRIVVVGDPTVVRPQLDGLVIEWTPSMLIGATDDANAQQQRVR